jgi:hypothetical protein
MGDALRERRNRSGLSEWEIERARSFNRAGMFAALGAWATLILVVLVFSPSGSTPWLAAIPRAGQALGESAKHWLRQPAL